MRLRAFLAAGILVSATGPSLALDARDCPQPRFTGKAPPEYYERANPLPASTDLGAMRKAYIGDRRNVSCASCHGEKGDSHGSMSDMFEPRPRNFACAQTVNGIPDGQLFWIIRFGSPGTAMPPHPQFSDDEVWRMVLYLRTLAR
jgi:mono/diheme cytochrome c family protein